MEILNITSRHWRELLVETIPDGRAAVWVEAQLQESLEPARAAQGGVGGGWGVAEGEELGGEQGFQNG